jgi:site-specific DNA-methyltransferase (adenine-specific)
LLGTFNLTDKNNRMNKEILGHSLEYLKTLEDESIDLILTDPPYNTTDCKWDKQPVNWEEYRKELLRILKKTGTLCISCQNPFTFLIGNLFLDYYRHRWIWEKNKCANFMVAKAQPMKFTEEILVFSKSGYQKSWNNNGKPKSIYNPQLVEANKKTEERKKHNFTKREQSDTVKQINNRKVNTLLKPDLKKPDNLKYPDEIIFFDLDKDRIHPTQKPILLFEHLIKTYTNEVETVLDCFAGSMTTAIACLNTDRKYICIEQEKEMYNKAKERIKNWHNDKASRLF